MLKQLFNKEQILKTLTTRDIWQWKVLGQYGNAESAAEAIVRNWKNDFCFLGAALLELF